MTGVLNLLAALALGGPARHPALTCLRYEPDTVAITGTLVRRTFYGAPGYGEDPQRDAKEVGFYLELSAPVCTLEGKDDDAATGVRLVQLVLDSAGYAGLRSRLDHTVTLHGTLFVAISGHHHAPLLLSVNRPVRVGLRR